MQSPWAGWPMQGYRALHAGQSSTTLLCST